MTINWDREKINYIRLYVYAEAATYEYSGLPSNDGTITVSADNVNSLLVYAYLFGTE